MLQDSRGDKNCSLTLTLTHADRCRRAHFKETMKSQYSVPERRLWWNSFKEAQKSKENCEIQCPVGSDDTEKKRTR